MFAGCDCEHFSAACGVLNWMECSWSSFDLVTEENIYNFTLSNRKRDPNSITTLDWDVLKIFMRIWLPYFSSLSRKPTNKQFVSKYLHKKLRSRSCRLKSAKFALNFRMILMENCKQSIQIVFPFILIGTFRQSGPVKTKCSICIENMAPAKIICNWTSFQLENETITKWKVR